MNAGAPSRPEKRSGRRVTPGDAEERRSRVVPQGGRPVIAYTDGACSGNPGPGGWGVVLVCGEHRRELSGGEVRTTNQRMELRAAIEALRALRRPCRVRLHSDSAYLVNGFQQRWFDAWKRNGWRTRDGKPVENRDLWEELLRLAEIHEVEWVKVAGHRGDPLNERADRLARSAIPAGSKSAG